MKTLISFNNDPALKALLIEEIKKHREADEISQGSYGDKEGPWCAVGCAIHSLNTRLGKNLSTSNHGAYETELGIPRIIARLEDRIFEGLESTLAKDFPLQFVQAVPVGKDLSLVWPKFAVWLLVDEKDGVLKYAKNEKSIASIKRVAELYQKQIDGETVDKQTWKDAYAAADAAATTTAATTTAYAAATTTATTTTAYAAAAYAATTTTAYAAAAYAATTTTAYAAAAAAYAATTTTAAAARKIHYGKCADKLIEILSTLQ